MYSYCFFLFYLKNNFHPIKVVSRCREAQLEVGEMYLYLLNLLILLFKHSLILIPNNCDLTGLKNWLPSKQDTFKQC